MECSNQVLPAMSVLSLVHSGWWRLLFFFSFSPTDNKFATCSDDGTVRIWDFLRCHEERILRGQRCCGPVQKASPGPERHDSLPDVLCVRVQVMALMWSAWTGIPPKAWWCQAARTASSPLSSGTPKRDKVWPHCEITDTPSWLIHYHGNQWLTCIFFFSHAHKNTVMEVKWNLNGNWLLTASRDHLCKLFDIRNLKEELQVFRGHKKEATGEEPDS